MLEFNDYTATAILYHACGWRSNDKKRMVEEYGIAPEEADRLIDELKKVEHEYLTR